MSDSIAQIEEIPRHGWLETPSELNVVGGVGESTTPIYLKQDDTIAYFGGGSKVRKLDFILAQREYEEAANLASVGAIGSSHLLSLAKAAQSLDKSFSAHTFFQPLSQEVVHNLSMTASLSTKLDYYKGRTQLAMSRPDLMLGRSWEPSVKAVSPGGSCGAGCAAFFAAAFEFSEQLSAQSLEPPKRLYIATGSAGGAVGLAMGFAALGLDIEVRAIATVEKLFLNSQRMRMVERACRRYLRHHGVSLPQAKLKLHLDSSQLGRGYGHETTESISACRRGQELNLHVEGVYTGKALAALLHDIHSGQAPTPLAFWNTYRNPEGDTPDDHWRSTLPRELTRHLSSGPHLSR